MIQEKVFQQTDVQHHPSSRLGTLSHLGIFAWSLCLVMLAPAGRTWLVAGLCLVVGLALYPAALRRIFRLRWLFFLGMLVVFNAFWMGEVERVYWGVPLKLDGLQAGLQMALRTLVVLVAIDGFSSAVDIAEVAGLLERLGLQGLGFSLGVAINLLPCLRQSSTNAWNSLWMRGGLRRQRWRALQFFMVTVVSNALRRADEIALAAEARAFSPQRSRALPLKAGKLDAFILLAALGSGLLLLILW